MNTSRDCPVVNRQETSARLTRADEALDQTVGVNASVQFQGVKMQSAGVNRRLGQFQVDRDCFSIVCFFVFPNQCSQLA